MTIGNLSCRAIIIFLAFVLIPFLIPINAEDVQGDVYVEASVSNPSPYVGQQFTYTFKLYDAVASENPLFQPSDFEGFWKVDIGVVSQTVEQIGNRRYQVTTIATALYATRAGELIIRPASVVLSGNSSRATTTLTARPIDVNVMALPEGKPAEFSGAVGKFAMSATIDRQTLGIGDNVVMSLTIVGSGNVEELAPPKLPEGWRSTISLGAYKSTFQNGEITGSRTYEVVFIPVVAGQQELPPIKLDYFDPVTKTYRSLNTAPIPIQVSSNSVTSSNPNQIIIEPSLSLKSVGNFDTSGTNPFVFLFMALVPLIVGIGGWTWQRLRIQRQIVRTRLNQQQALQRTEDRLNLIDLHGTRLDYEVLNLVISEYVEIKSGLSLRVNSLNSIERFLTSTSDGAAIVSRFQLIVSLIEEGLFSPNISPMTSKKRDEVVKLLREIDAMWSVR